jgi:hypothetical protein
MAKDVDLQEVLARLWNLEHDSERSTSPEQVRIRWDDARMKAEFQLCDVAGVIATGTLQFKLGDEVVPLAAASSESAIKKYMANAWNERFPKQPTSEATIRVNWVSATKAEIDLGSEHEVFGAAEWTSIANFRPIISGPYSVPPRSW